MSKTLRFTIGLIVSVVCVWLVFRNVSFSEVSENIRQAKKGWFLMIFLTMLGSHFLRALRWRELLSPIKKLPTLPMFILLTLGLFMNNVLPARAGELIRAYALDREMKIPTSTALGSIALERLCDMVALLFVLFIAAQVLPDDKIPVSKILMMILLGITLVGLLIVFFQRRRGATDQLHPLINGAITFFKNLTQGFAALKSPSRMAAVIAMSLAIWMLEILNIIWIGRAFSINLPISHAAATLTGIAVGVMIPAAPGFIGTFEYFGQQPLLFLGYAGALTFSLVFSLHVFQLIVNSLLGLPGFFKIGWGPRR